MPSRVKTTQSAVLQAIVTRLQAALSLSPGQCFLSVNPEPGATVSHQMWITVSPEDGKFDDALLAGAGREGCIEQTWAVVTLFSEVRLDRTDQHVTILTDNARGVLAQKARILSALTMFEPTNEAGNYLLCEPIRPVSAPRPLTDGKKVGDVQLWFSTQFMWDMPAAIPSLVL